jgi:hypothetical protein
MKRRLIWRRLIGAMLECMMMGLLVALGAALTWVLGS